MYHFIPFFSNGDKSHSNEANQLKGIDVSESDGAAKEDVTSQYPETVAPHHIQRIKTLQPVDISKKPKLVILHTCKSIFLQMYLPI